MYINHNRTGTKYTYMYNYGIVKKQIQLYLIISIELNGHHKIKLNVKDVFVNHSCQQQLVTKFILWNHLFSWGPIFVDSWKWVHSWGRNFVGWLVGLNFKKDSKFKKTFPKNHIWSSIKNIGNLNALKRRALCWQATQSYLIDTQNIIKIVTQLQPGLHKRPISSNYQCFGQTMQLIL